MSVQVLITTMYLDSYPKLLNQLNISSDFVIGNQTDKESIETVEYGIYKGVVVSKNEKGVGNNRNMTLKYAKSDICVLSDDDMRFIDNYSEVVEAVFSDLPDADVVVFNLENGGQGRKVNSKIVKLNRFNYMNYGAARMAFRRKSVSYYGVFFNTNFGGGTRFSAGEDGLFLGDCIKRGLNVYAVPRAIASLTEGRDSTWFRGYNEKYLFDKGVFLAISNPRLAKLMAFYLAFRHWEYRTDKRGCWLTYKEICKGVDYILKREFISDETES